MRIVLKHPYLGLPVGVIIDTLGAGVCQLLIARGIAEPADTPELKSVPQPHADKAMKTSQRKELRRGE